MAALVGAALSVVGCGVAPSGAGNATTHGSATPAPIGDQAGVATCTSQGLAFARASVSDAHVVAGYSSTAGGVAQWQEHPRWGGTGYVERSSFRDDPAAEPVAVCFLDGTFAAWGRYPPPLPGGPSTSAAAFDRVVVLIPQSGQPIVDTAGTHSLSDTDRP